MNAFLNLAQPMMIRSLYVFLLFHSASIAQVSISGDVTPSPAGSPVWSIPDTLIVGNTFNGEFSISGIGSVSSSGGIFGNQGGVTGSATLSGGTWSNAGETWIGNSGLGTLVLNGGSLTNTIGNIARNSGSTGSVTMSAGTWNNSNLFVVGNAGNGSFTQTGGTVNSVTSEIGRTVGGVGVATISGGNWTNSGSLTVGVVGNGNLNLNGGTVTASQVAEGVGNGTITFNGGTLRVGGNQSALFSGFEAGDVTTVGAGATIDTQGFTVATGYGLGGNGSLTKQGTGTLELTGTNTYTGATSVQAGRLILNGSPTTSSVTVANGGTLSPGSTASTLTLNGLTFADTAFLDFQLGTPGIVGGGVNDLINVNGNLVLGGLLNIEALSGFGAGGYRLMNYTGSLTNNTLLFGNVPGGFEYAVSTATANQVNLSVTAATAQYWDGGFTTPQGVPGGNGGDGTWSLRNTNWTNAGGNANSNYLANLTSVFGGASGTVTIADGYNARASGLTFQTNGYSIGAAGSGTLELTGSGVVDTLANSATISAPIGGTSTLTKQGSGTLTLSGDNTLLGGTFLHQGNLTLTGTGAIRTFPVTVGQNNGDSATFANNGGYISSSGVTLGSAAGSSGNMTMTGGMADLNGEFRVGDAGSGVLTISGGAILAPSSLPWFVVGREAGSEGTVTMSGGNLSGFRLSVGNSGNGTFSMSGGTLQARGLDHYVGAEAGSNGVMQLSGNANVDMHGGLSIGRFGNGSLEISDNASLRLTRHGWLVVGGSYLTPNTTGTGTANMTGGSINALSAINIGYRAATGNFTISGGNVSTRQTLIGQSTSSTPSVLTMTGGTWTNGLSGTTIETFLVSRGMFNLQGGTFSSKNSVIGHAGLASGTATANVSGGTWINTEELRVGNAGGTGIVNLTGGTISNTIGNVGRQAGGTGTVNASGGVWTNTSQLIAGNEGTGTVTISGTAEVNAPDTVVGRMAGGVGTLNLNGGLLSTGAVREELGNGTVNFNGGTLRLTGNQANLFGGFETGDVSIGAGGATIDTQNFTVSASSGIGGTGGLTKLGTGTLAIGGTNTYAGATSITDGSFVVNGSLASSSVTMSNGTTLSGNGSIAGPVNLGTGVTINPGDGVGTLTTGNLALNSSSILNFGLGPVAASDRIAVNGNLTLDGTLNIAGLSGFGAGTYRLFDYTGSLTDNGLLFGILPGAFDLTLSTSTGNQINLLVTTASAQYWDGSNTTPQGTPNGTGGSSTWDSATTNWTNTAGNANAAWLGNATAVFAGANGTVTIADGFSATAPAITFSTDGYTLAAAGTGTLSLTGSGILNVVNGTATISAPITGSGRIEKQGPGTLSLTGNNSYTGETWLRDGTLNLTGSISHPASDFAVGRFTGDVASLTLSGTASLTNFTGFLGADSGSTGNATISGGTWTNHDELRVGDFGNGTLNLTGGAITSTIGNIARSVGSTGTVTMSGGTWTNSVQFVVGNQGVGSLTLTYGTISSSISSIGLNAGGTGTATMTGGTWNNSGEMRVGDFGDGTLNLSGGNITSTNANIGRSVGGTGNLNMTGGAWTASGDFLVGNAGTGTFALSNGTVSNANGIVGFNSGGVGTVTISGGTWTNSDELRVGDSGIGSITITAGAITNTIGNIARNSESSGTVNMSGGTWTNTSLLVVGNAGLGEFNQTGGIVTNTDGEIGRNSSGTGVATVSGGTWTNTGTLTIGKDGTGTLNLLPGGNVVVQGGTVNIALGTNSLGTLNFGSADLTTTSGTLDATSIVFGTGNGTINFNQTNALTVSAAISGEGEVRQRGTGTTTLTANNTHTGDVLVTGGNLIVNGKLISSTVTVSNGGRLGGTGTIGESILGTGAILAPGNSIGTFTAASLAWQAGAGMYFELGDGTSDMLRLSGALTKSGLGDFLFTFQDLGWAVGQTYSLIKFNGTEFSEGDFGYTNSGGFAGTFLLNADSLDFTITAIPESGVSVLCLLAATGCLAIRRRPASSRPW